MQSVVPPELEGWFAGRGWRVRRHQIDMLDASDADRHALLVADTGAGKTLAGFLPTLADFTPSRLDGDKPPEGLHTLYVSPLKALAHDVQRNLLTPIDELGLPIRVETRSGDTPSDRKKRQRTRPPHVLLTTPESLSLLLSYPDSVEMFRGLKRVVIDEVHAFATGKRGDLLALALARLQAIAPGMRRAALSATLANPEGFREWLAPWGDIDTVRLVEGEAGARAEVEILLPDEERVPWGGHAATWAIPQLYEQIRANRTTLIFTNTRFLAEYIFQNLWDVNEENLPIGVHHGSLSKEARRKVEGAMARGELRALVATASLDLGVDWGDIDLVVQMGAPKGSSRLLQRIGRANHRLDQPSRALLVPGNRFEFLEATAAKEAVDEGKRDGEEFRPGGLDVLAQHVMACACAAPFQEAELLAEVRSSLSYAWLDEEIWERVLSFVETGGYALKAYDKFKRIVRDADGVWRLSHPEQAQRHRMNAGIIIDAEMLDVRISAGRGRGGRSLGKVEERFAASLSPGDTFAFAGMSLEVIKVQDMEVVVKAAKASAMIPSYGGARLPLTTHLADRVRTMLVDRAGWARFPDDVREWLEVQDWRSQMPGPGQLLVESFPHAKRHYSVYYTFEGWNANQSLGMLITRRMEDRGLMPGGQEGAAKIFQAAIGYPVVVQQYVAGQVPVFRSQSVRDPRSQAGGLPQDSPGMQQQVLLSVQGLLPLHRAEHADVVDDPGDFRQQIADDHSAVSAGSKLADRGQQPAGDSLGPQRRSRWPLSLECLQCRLGIEQVTLVGAAVHEQLDHAAGLAAVMRQRLVGRESRGDADGAEASTEPSDHGPP